MDLYKNQVESLEAETNKSTLIKANEAVTRGDYETFLSFCREDSVWTFVGDQTLIGKDAVRKYITENYVEPPKFSVQTLIAQGDLLTAVGNISLKLDGKWINYEYCDVWRFRDGLLWQLRGFVISI